MMKILAPIFTFLLIIGIVGSIQYTFNSINTTDKSIMSVDSVDESKFFAVNTNMSFSSDNNYKLRIVAEDFNYTNTTISINKTYITNISYTDNMIIIKVK